MTTTTIRQFPNQTFSLLDENGEAHLLAFDEGAVYRLDLALTDPPSERCRTETKRRESR